MRISDYELNRLRLLRTIHRSGPVARTELVSLTGLAAGTVSEVTADLVQRGVVVEEKLATGGRGRPRTQLSINAEAAHAVGIFLRMDGAAAVEVINLKGDRVFTNIVKLQRVDHFESLIEEMAEIVDQTIAASPVSKSDIRRAGFVLQGMVDSARGTAHWFPGYSVTSLPLAAHLEERLQLPVVIDSNANVLASVEHWFGNSDWADNFSTFLLSIGIGTAHYVDGVRWAGAHGLNPEGAHQKVTLNAGPTCYCGARGCLASYCSILGIVSQICEARGHSRPALFEMPAVFREFAAQAQAGDQQAQEVFDRAADYLAMAVANLINARDPGKILLLSFEEEFPALLSDRFYTVLHENTLPALRGLSSAEFRVIGDDHYWKGAAIFALESIYRSV